MDKSKRWFSASQYILFSVVLFMWGSAFNEHITSFIGGILYMIHGICFHKGMKMTEKDVFNNAFGNIGIWMAGAGGVVSVISIATFMITK